MIRIEIDLPLGARTLPVALESAARAIAIVGPSGIGKSTLLRAIAGIAPARGTIAIDGVAIEGLAVHERRVGWVPQDALLWPHLDVRENIGLAARDRTSIDRAISIAGIERSLLGRAPATLSGGEKQRVAIARALATRPRILLLDEALSALDRDARAELARTIVQACDEDGAIRIVVAHDEADVAALAEERHSLRSPTISGGAS